MPKVWKGPGERKTVAVNTISVSSENNDLLLLEWVGNMTITTHTLNSLARPLSSRLVCCSDYFHIYTISSEGEDKASYHDSQYEVTQCLTESRQRDKLISQQTHRRGRGGGQWGVEGLSGLTLSGGTALCLEYIPHKKRKTIKAPQRKVKVKNKMCLNSHSRDTAGAGTKESNRHAVNAGRYRNNNNSPHHCETHRVSTYNGRDMDK
ncbi:hypothetical protein FQN60_010920 [Etheostoma spectabile]|uniref:Uncharacterized protein n=1 Tax=Etheostoma spectabile TaxID=54343 RepID=A0A5J5DQM0_9PERO|nr:hypothetical protein FQN60_010920 [Etheostoma spectabile]